MSPLLAAVVGLLAFLSDASWAKYTLHASHKRALPAALWGVAIFAFGAVGVYVFVSDPLYIIPEAFGGAVGTYVTIRAHSD